MTSISFSTHGLRGPAEATSATEPDTHHAGPRMDGAGRPRRNWLADLAFVLSAARPN